MVKKLLFFLVYTLFFIGALIYFSPKEQLFYLAESSMKEANLYIYNETFYDNGFSFSLQDFDISFESVKALHAMNATCSLFGISNSIIVQDITLSGALSSFIPLKIESLELSYSILNPLNITLYSKGDFGEAHGNFALLEQEAKVSLIPSQQMQKEFKHTLREFKQDTAGGYIYAKKL